MQLLVVHTLKDLPERFVLFTPDTNLDTIQDRRDLNLNVVFRLETKSMKFYAVPLEEKHDKQMAERFRSSLRFGFEG